MTEKQKGTQKKDSAANAAKLPMRGLAVWLLLIALFLTLFQLFAQKEEKHPKISYNPDFVNKVNEGKVRKCEIVLEVSGFQFIRGELNELDPKTGRPRRFKVDVVVTDELPKWLEENGVSFEYKQQNPYLWQIISSAVPFLLLIGLLYFLFVRQMRIAGRGAMSFGKSRARMLTRDKNAITFKDVAGIDEAKDEVQEIIEFLRDPKRFQKLGGRIPKGVMLVGPPGTGKTLLAKAIAGEAQVPFFTISGSDFVEMFVGVGASRVRDMFEQGKKNAPCIIFIDEIDAVGRSRFTGIGGGHDEREQTLNALLVEMDGFETQEGVIIIAATNRPDVLDNALLRPGRFDRQIVVDLPDVEGRVAILKIHAKKVKLQKDVELRRVARGTPGFSGADLANLINEAALLAARRGADAIELQDMEEARDKVRWGRERRSRRLDDKEKRLTAYHEAGHAIVLQVLEETEPLHKVTIIPRGAALGSTMQLPEKDRYTQNRQSLLDMMAGMMGGRAAEEMIFNDITTGAQNDLKQATHIARLMVCEWGMSPLLGPQSFGAREELMFLGREVSRSQEYSEETACKIDAEISRLLNENYDRAKRILNERKECLVMVADLLLERETLEGRDIEDLVKHGRILDEVERSEEDEAHKKQTDGDGTGEDAKNAEDAGERVPHIDETA
ncbi:MAG: ATP-dependent metallopeptidase FtsH/Yme1/Tma family protein [Spartobacteria bacterium]|nr:ATP-dependent metallopeptidase FtsH/Yme1/Tma family protein [Spartobacteria bacterium]